MISTKGQSVVEFAIVLPLFLLFMFGIIYFGMAFADYMSLNDVARSCAREASQTSGSNYTEVYKKYSNNDLVAGLYKWDGKTSSDDFKIETKDKGKRVLVHIHATLDGKDSLVQTFKNLLGNQSLFDINIDYSMYKE